MEPLDIDWKNMESIYIKDDLYEHINAPKYVDFTATEGSVDDIAWFCRPDCRHPQSAEDVKVKHLRSVSASGIMPLGERNCRDANLKRRGMVPSENTRSRKPPKNYRENGENENPNTTSVVPPSHPIGRSKTFKSSTKLNAEKKKEVKPSDHIADTPQAENRHKLKSTSSARNLFAGRDILNQISEFCNELKKLAMNGSEKERPEKSVSVKNVKGMEKKEQEPMLEPERTANGSTREERRANTKIFSPESWWKRNVMDGSENSQLPAASSSNGKCKGDKGFLQVRSCPPSPQHFPSPLKPTKSRTIKRGILQEAEKSPITAVAEENKNISSLIEEERSLDMFWFLKPCAYIGK